MIDDALLHFQSGHNPPPVYFYCSRSSAEPTRSDPAVILASIARQLSYLRPGDPILEPTIDFYRKKEADAFASGPMRVEESCDLITQLTEYYQMTTIIIDALDECDPSKLDKLLGALEKILQDSFGLVKIFVSSRDDQDIVSQLQRYPNLEIDSRRNAEDIASFVRAETCRLIQKKKLLKHSQAKKQMEEFVVSKVVEGSTGM